MQSFIVSAHGASSGLYTKVPDNCTVELVARPMETYLAEFNEVVFDTQAYARLKQTSYPVTICQAGDVCPNLLMSFAQTRQLACTPQGVFRSNEVDGQMAQLFAQRKATQRARTGMIERFQTMFNRFPDAHQKTEVFLSEVFEEFGDATYIVAVCRNPAAGLSHAMQLAMQDINTAPYQAFPPGQMYDAQELRGLGHGVQPGSTQIIDRRSHQLENKATVSSIISDMLETDVIRTRLGKRLLTDYHYNP